MKQVAPRASCACAVARPRVHTAMRDRDDVCSRLRAHLLLLSWPPQILGQDEGRWLHGVVWHASPLGSRRKRKEEKKNGTARRRPINALTVSPTRQVTLRPTFVLFHEWDGRHDGVTGLVVPDHGYSSTRGRLECKKSLSRLESVPGRANWQMRAFGSFRSPHPCLLLEPFGFRACHPWIPPS
jgi:hypothetical protein